MPRFVIEVSNRKFSGPAYIHPGELVVDANGRKSIQVRAAGILLLHPNSETSPTRVQLTSEQFKQFSYDLEAKSEGKYGCAKEIDLFALDVDKQDRLQLSFAEAADMVASNVNDDEAALADQAKQAAEIEKLADDRDEEEIEADRVDTESMKGR